MHRRVKRLVAHEAATLLLVASAGVLVPAGIGLLRPELPRPVIHDEFAYVLGAETFAGGRLANSPLDCAEHFQSPHVLQRPTYSSKFPPGQSLALALGIKTFGHPIFGVWLTCGLAAAATTWMLRRWTRPLWAAVGGGLVIATLGSSTYWSQSYWGGMVALIGGALTLGAVGPRRSASTRSRLVVMGVGLSVLLMSRPFEGFLLAAPVAAFALARVATRERRALLITLVYVGAGVLPGLLFVLAHNRAVTGNALVLPYMEYSRQADTVPLFGLASWHDGLEVRPAEAGLHPRMVRFAEAIQAFYFSTTFRRNLFHVAQTVGAWLGLVSPAILLVPLLFLPPRVRGEGWLLAAVLGATLCGRLVTWLNGPNLAHYLAPATPILFLAIVQGLRVMSTIRGRGPLRLLNPAALVLGMAAVLWVFRFGSEAYLVVRGQWGLAAPSEDYARARAGVLAHLHSLGGRHLVLVAYGDDASVHEEWVYNSPDLDRAPVIFAHQLGDPGDVALRRRFSDRSAWLATVGRGGSHQLVRLPAEPTDRARVDLVSCAERGPAQRRLANR